MTAAPAAFHTPDAKRTAPGRLSGGAVTSTVERVSGFHDLACGSVFGILLEEVGDDFLARSADRCRAIGSGDVHPKRARGRIGAGDLVNDLAVLVDEPAVRRTTALRLFQRSLGSLRVSLVFIRRSRRSRR